MTMGEGLVDSIDFGRRINPYTRAFIPSHATAAAMAGLTTGADTGQRQEQPWTR